MKKETASPLGKPVRGILVTPTAAAKYIGCGKTWFYAHISLFNHFDCDYGKRFDTADLDDYLSRKKRPGVVPEGGPK